MAVGAFVLAAVLARPAVGVAQVRDARAPDSVAPGAEAPRPAPSDPRPDPGRAHPVARADALYYANDPAGSFEVLERHLALEPLDYEALWRAARALVVLGVQDMGGSRAQNRWLDPAMAFGDRAVAARADGVDGLYWRGAAYGRRAMNAAPSYAAQLVQEMWDDAHAILAVDPAHGGAHNLLGKLNYEVMSLSRIQRAVARIFMGNEALSNASWEMADRHLRRAVELWPDLVLFQYDLALLLRKRAPEEEARLAFERVLALAPVHPPDAALQVEARAYLDELGSR